MGDDGDMRSSKAVAAEEDSLNRAAAAVAPHQQAGGRRKATGNIRAWLVVSDTGRSYLEEVGKHSIMRRTGLPARDLRVLDPQLSYPSTILGRERAIVINLEHIKAVITATEVLVPNSRDPLVAPFVQDLQARVSSNSYGAPQQVAASDDVDADGTAMAVPTSQTQSGSPRLALDAYNNGSTKILPFEFIALEVCLESACRILESEFRKEESGSMKSALHVCYRSPPAAAVVAAMRSSRCFSEGKGRILSEEEKAAEKIYIQKMEREKLEKLKRKAEKEKAEAEKEKADKK